MEEKGHFVSKLFSATFHAHMICWSYAFEVTNINFLQPENHIQEFELCPILLAKFGNLSK